MTRSNANVNVRGLVNGSLTFARNLYCLGSKPCVGVRKPTPWSRHTQTSRALLPWYQQAIKSIAQTWKHYTATFPQVGLGRHINGMKSCGSYFYQHVTARFVTRFNLWLRHDLWPQNASICDPARFVTKSASICDQRYTMILESKLCRGKLVFVFTLIMNATWYNMMHIYIWTVL